MIDHLRRAKSDRGYVFGRRWISSLNFEENRIQMNAKDYVSDILQSIMLLRLPQSFYRTAAGFPTKIGETHFANRFRTAANIPLHYMLILFLGKTMLRKNF